MGRHPPGEAMPHEPDPPAVSGRHPLLTEAAARFEAGDARVEFRRLVERAMRLLDEDRRRREVAELLHLAQFAGDVTAN